MKNRRCKFFGECRAGTSSCFVKLFWVLINFYIGVIAVLL